MARHALWRVITSLTALHDDPHYVAVKDFDSARPATIRHGLSAGDLWPRPRKGTETFISVPFFAESLDALMGNWGDMLPERWCPQDFLAELGRCVSRERGQRVVGSSLVSAPQIPPLVFTFRWNTKHITATR